jgi:acyl carrier protein
VKRACAEASLWSKGRSQTLRQGRDHFFSTGEACMSEVFERVKAIVIKHLEAPPEKVTEKASFIDDLGADSLDNVELVMAFEEEFGIEIPDDAAEHIQTVGDAVKFISEKQG